MNPQEVAELSSPFTYERAIVEQSTVGDKRVLRIFQVDGGEILNEPGQSVPCWNALSPSQQRTLVEGNHGPPIRHGNGVGCDQPATVMIETVHDETPGPRFYCLRCASIYLGRLGDEWERERRL